MPNNSPEQRIETQIKYLDSLSTEERRASVIEMRESQLKAMNTVIIYTSILGLLGFAGIIYMWLVEYCMSPASSFGIISGVILNTVGFQYVKSKNFESLKRLQSDNFTDEDIVTYFQEIKENNQKSKETWNKKGRYYFIAVYGIGFLLHLNCAMWKFTTPYIWIGLSTYLILFTASALVQQRNFKKR